MQKKLRIIILSILCCLAGKSLADGETLINYVLVTDASTLAEGDKLIIVNTSEGMAMAVQDNNNFKAENVTVSNGIIVLDPSDNQNAKIQVLTLEGVTDAWYFKTNDGKYLCAASSSANQLKTKEDKDNNNNAKAKITISSNNATIKFQGSYTRNLLRYNSSSGLFSCYSSGQQPVQLYRQETGESPELSFSATTATYTFGDGAFTEPTLTKAEGAPAAVFSSSNAEVASVDAATGKVTINKAGEVTIKAVTPKTDDYRSGSASYKLTISKGETVLSYAETNYSVNVNEAFATPVLSNVRGVEVSYGSSDATVAEVDASTGAVTILSKRGTTTITASFAGNDQYTSAEASYDITVSDPIITTAMTAEEVTVFYESFNTNNGTGGNDGAWSGNIASNTITFDNTGWGNSSGNGANECIKFGSLKNKGSATTPSIAVSEGLVYTLTFNAAPWNKESASVNLTVTGGTVSGLSTDVMTAEQWNNYSCTITATAPTMRIKFESSQNRMFLDEVRLKGRTLTDVVANTVSGALYGTLYLGNYSVKVPEGAEAYTMTLNGEGMLARSKTYSVGDVVPAGTAVVVHGAAGVYNFQLTDDEGEGDDNNLLRGSDKAETTTGPDGESEGYRFYMLSLDREKTEGSVGFYFNKGCPNGEAFTNGAHKAYLALEEGMVGGAKESFLFSELVDADMESTEEDPVEPEVTGIDHTELMPASDAPRYNLAGQRVGKGYKGIYIIRGRKVKG